MWHPSQKPRPGFESPRIIPRLAPGGLYEGRSPGLRLGAFIEAPRMSGTASGFTGLKSLGEWGGEHEKYPIDHGHRKERHQ